MMFNLQIIVVTILIVTITWQSTLAENHSLLHSKGQHLSCTLDIELCQICAKATKSVIAYPYCCENKEGVYRWCRAYVGFGLQKRSGMPQMKKLKCHRFPYSNPNTFRKEIECLCPSEDQKRVECSKKAHMKIGLDHKQMLHTNQL